MSHQIYTTKGFVVSSSSKGESDKIFSIFTKDLGLIRATAQGVRKIESKLRFALQDFSFCEISVVMTKAGWRLVGATSLDSFSKDPIKVKSLRLLKKLSAEDDQNENLFEDILKAFYFIDSHRLDIDEKSLEILIIVKILNALGYWGNEVSQDLVVSPFDGETLKVIWANQKEIIKEINRSLRATQLV